MKQITLRLPTDLLNELDEEAEKADISRSEHVRNVLQTRENTDALRDRIQQKEERIQQLEDQLARRSQLEEKIEDLPDKIRTIETYQERRQRLLDQASFAQRLLWKVSGVPVENAEHDEGLPG
jgi:metal-responsive CopG/Arc/MetJ family transcriptional regulator